MPIGAIDFIADSGQGTFPQLFLKSNPIHPVPSGDSFEYFKLFYAKPICLQMY